MSKCIICQLEYRKIDLNKGVCGECEEQHLDQIDSDTDRVEDKEVPL